MKINSLFIHVTWPKYWDVGEENATLRMSLKNALFSSSPLLAIHARCRSISNRFSSKCTIIWYSVFLAINFLHKKAWISPQQSTNRIIHIFHKISFEQELATFKRLVKLAMVVGRGPFLCHWGHHHWFLEDTERIVSAWKLSLEIDPRTLSIRKYFFT